MNNKDIARQFSLLARITELYDDNSFKSKSYNNAYITIRKHPVELSTLNSAEIKNIPRLGKAISLKVTELIETGKIEKLEDYLQKTPSGIVEMLNIKGLGSKKIRTIWKDLRIESIGELLQAINENRLIKLKGFGPKTQASLKIQLEYHLESKDKALYSTAENVSIKLKNMLSLAFPDNNICFTGPIFRKEQIIDVIDLITDVSNSLVDDYITISKAFEKRDQEIYFHNFRLKFHFVRPEMIYFEQAKLSFGESFWKLLNIKEKNYVSDKAVFSENNLQYIIPEYREDHNIDYYSKSYRYDTIITIDDIKGCIHNHSTYSDGANSLVEMTEATIDKGYEYLVMTDHSKSAFYANGLDEDRLMTQLDEIRKIDQSFTDIKLFSGIESDILSDGSLDYDNSILTEIDVIIASIHSNLNMDESKATRRLIKAIENPYTSILGHPTGRLLLSRKGYPINYHKVIDACAANNVAIEINANPLRLDIDWTYIQYATDKGVLISINPDAHSIKGIDDIYYGVCAARKAGLSRYNCLNSLDLEEFEEWVTEQHLKRPNTA